MSKRPRDLHPEEKTLWRRVVAGVKPRRLEPEWSDDETPAGKRSPTRPSLSPSPPPPPAKRHAAKAPPANRSGEKRVRRGKLAIGGTLDLHGYHQDSGRAALIRFLQAAHMRGDRTLIVVTGAGRSGQGVLRQRLPEWLAASDLRAIVSGYAPAHRSHGGAGAFYVFLKAARRD